MIYHTHNINNINNIVFTSILFSSIYLFGVSLNSFNEFYIKTNGGKMPHKFLILNVPIYLLSLSINLFLLHKLLKV